MKKSIIIFIIMLSGIALHAQNQKPLEVIIENVNNDQGLMMVALFNSEETFTSKPWKGEKPGAHKGAMHVFFNDVPAGKYAIAVYHDENQNAKMDSNFMGIPKEGYGFSNDAMGTFGPPSFEKALIQWTGVETYTIHLKY